MDITVQDRDALAIEFSKENAIHNSLTGVRYSGNFALDGIKDGSQDLILSNLPAKAGNTVLQDFISRSLKYLSSGGICAVVVVATLKDTIQTAIRKTEAEIIYTEDTREYSVFHYSGTDTHKKPGNENNNKDLRECYIRNTVNFRINKLQYTLKTVYNLPGFDTIPYHIETAAQVLEKQPVSGRTLFWNPGQGHLPIISHLANPGRITETILASRDILQLKISKGNLKDTFSFDNEEHLSLKHICCPEKLCTDAMLRVSPVNNSSSNHSSPSANNIDASSTDAMLRISPANQSAHSSSINNTDKNYDSIVISLDDSDDIIMTSFLPITTSGAVLVMAGKSSYIAGAVKNHKGWIQLNSRKYRGFRGVVFRRG